MNERARTKSKQQNNKTIKGRKQNNNQERTMQAYTTVYTLLTAQKINPSYKNKNQEPQTEQKNKNKIKTRNGKQQNNKTTEQLNNKTIN